MANAKRKDKSRVVLRTGEVQRANGTYHFCWTDKNGKRHYIYAKTLEELREKEKQVQRDKADGIKAEARYVTINDLFDLWIQIKRGVKNNTFENYKYMFNTFVRPNFGKMRIGTLKKSDVKRFYNYLADEAHKTGCYFNVNTPKTKASVRQVPMLDFVKEAFLMEREYQELMGVKCEVTIDGYTDFIFVNRYGRAQHGGTLNKAIQRIIRDCNDEELLKDENATVLLPHFSCHSLRHTFTTRMCEAGVNVKVIQDTLGHQDISTTLNIYADVTRELKKSEFDGLDIYFKKQQGSTSASAQQ